MTKAQPHKIKASPHFKLLMVSAAIATLCWGIFIRSQGWVLPKNQLAYYWFSEDYANKLSPLKETFITLSILIPFALIFYLLFLVALFLLYHFVLKIKGFWFGT